ncbi:MAG: lipoate--protein ligase, partial [Aquificota bacterium]
IKEDLYNSLSIKEDAEEKENRRETSFGFSPYLADFRPEYYRKPKAVPTPQEDRTRTSMQREVFLGEATIGEEVVGYREAFDTLARWLKESERPTIVLGPLVFWDFGEKELQEKARLLRELIEKVGRFNVKVLPDYRPKLKKYDPSVEMDPPNPHHAVLHGRHDLTVLVGVHCYRTDFVIRLLRKYTDTKVVALCGLYGHPTAHLSTSFTDAEKLEDFTKLL